MRIAFMIFLALLHWGCKPGAGDIPAGDGPPPPHTGWTDLLQKYVDDEGFVNYRDWVSDTGSLDQYLALLSVNPPGEAWSKEEQIAYWVNAYNAFTVKLILDHYPVESIKNIRPGIPFVNSVWDLKFFSIGGKPIDLNTIEHGILRKAFDEPRIHFAINCASISCPDLRREAYVAGRLDAQLTEQAESFLSDSGKNRITADDIVISKIFSWFGGDFKKQGSLIEFLNKYSRVRIDEDAQISYMEYNWDLNNQKGKTMQ